MWLFLSLKNAKNVSKNQLIKESSQYKNKYGEHSLEPTVETKNLLLMILKERLLGYEEYEKSFSKPRVQGSRNELVHVGSAAFLRTEYNLLKLVRDSLIKLEIKSIVGLEQAGDGEDL